MSKEMSEHGMRTKAGKLLSAYIRQIAEETTETVKDPVSGEDRMATKAEKLARDVWRDALGWKEMEIKNGQAVETIHFPSKIARAMLFDRIEGRAPLTIGEGDDKISVSERVSEQGKKRINETLNDSRD